jgi:UDP-GlcNAc:undecaprenyl-phosphate GlcNAc-1-phosphate transferase
LPADAVVASAFALSLVVVLAATPLAIRIADRTGFHDQPIGYKGHSKPTPYLGGAAVFSGFLLGALLAGTAGSKLAWVLVCAVLLWLVGTLDDRFNVTPLLRVLAEIGCAGILFAADLGWSMTGSGAADFAITALWLVALSNAFNLMDNMDGAACTVALFSSLGTAVIALVLGESSVAALALAMCGACLGFLRYNLAGPARIFLGDGGSMPMGFVVGATIMALPLDDELAWHQLATAVLLAGLPLLDTTLVILSRRRAGISLLQGGRDHITHRLRRRLPSARAVAAALGTAQAILCAIALWLVQHDDTSTTVAWALMLGAAAAAVAIMESGTWAPARPEPEPPEPGAASAGPPAPGAGAEPAAAGEPGEAAQPGAKPPLLRTYPLEVVLVVITAASCGLSPFLYGFYSLGTWGPIALGLLALLLGLTIARPAVPRRAALVALAGLAGLALWALVSGGWAGSPGNALVEANRWILYATLFAILLLLLRDDRLGRLLLGVATAFVLALGAYVLIRMLGGAEDLFLNKRLNKPLGYVNGQASYFLLGLWPLIAVAERAKRAWLSGAAIAGAAMLGSLILLSETRAIVPAIAISALVLLVLVPGRVRRGWAIVAIALAVAAISGPLLHVYDASGQVVEEGAVRDAAIAIVVGSLVIGAVWAAVVAAADRASRIAGPATRRAPAVALVVLVLAAVGAVAVVVDDPAGAVSRQYDAFTNLQSASDQQSRFLSGGGNRYDYWRIALDEFGDEPVRGVGAGSYQFAYFEERRTPEDIRQPHSLELQTLSELGLVGGILLALFLGSVLVGLASRTRRARNSAPDAALTVAAGGIFVVWLVHTSVDWIHLIPGVTGLALAAAAVLLAPWRAARSRPRDRRHRIVVALAALLVVGAAIYLGRATLADRYGDRAQDTLTADPRRALDDTGRSLDLNGDSVPVHYTRSAAYARLGDYNGARGALLDALEVEPRNFVTWALLGDLATRRGEVARARTYYARALRLNPRDPQLPALARHPPTEAP